MCFVSMYSSVNSPRIQKTEPLANRTSTNMPKTGLVRGAAHIAVPTLLDGEGVTVPAAPILTADGRPAVPIRAAGAWKVGAEGGLDLLALLDLAPCVRVVSGPDEIPLGNPPAPEGKGGRDRIDGLE